MAVRKLVLPWACFCAAAAVGLVAVADHHSKQAASNRAELSEWYCGHRGTRCGGPSSNAIERHWNEREFAYKIAVIGLSAAGSVFAVRRVILR